MTLDAFDRPHCANSDALASSFSASYAGVVAFIAVATEGSFGRDPVDGLFTLAAEIRIRLPGVERTIAEGLVRNTERICPYAKMARAGIDCVVLLDH